MGRVGFLNTLLDKAKTAGHSVYEELQGGSVIKSAVADWNEIVKDTAKGVKEDVDTIAAWISPTIDATPGRHTIEDTIDNIIFDPQSQLGPLELIGLGSLSGSKAAIEGTKWAAKRIGVKADLGMQALEEGSKGAQKLGRSIVKTKRAIANPRRAIEGALETGSSKIQNKAIDEYVDIFRLATRENPALRKELMDSFPEIRKAAVDWDDFGKKLYHGNPTAANMFLTKSGRAKRTVGEGVIKGLDVAEDIFPKGAPPGGGTIEGDLIKSPIFAAVGARQKAHKLADKKKKENDFWKVGGSK